MAWSARGIAETSGWQVAKLYDLVCEVYEKRVAFDDVLALRRNQHRRMPSPTTYALLGTATEAGPGWASNAETCPAGYSVRPQLASGGGGPTIAIQSVNPVSPFYLAAGTSATIVITFAVPDGNVYAGPLNIDLYFAAA